MKYAIGLPLDSFYYYIPFFLPSSLMGSVLGLIVLYKLEKMDIIPKNNKKKYIYFIITKLNQWIILFIKSK